MIIQQSDSQRHALCDSDGLSISVAVSLVTLVITLMLRKPAGGSAAQTPATPAAAAPPAA